MVYFLVDVRVALVTGGNRGMGFEICRQLASSGLTVVLTARNETRGVEAVDRLRGLGLPDVVFHQLDITEPASAARLADFVRSKFGKLDVLVRLFPLSLPGCLLLLTVVLVCINWLHALTDSYSAGQQRRHNGSDDGGWRRGSHQRNGTYTERGKC